VQQFLVRQKVGRQRLVSEGYGESRPLEPNCKQRYQGRKKKKLRLACWKKNRRVEFNIVRVDESVPVEMRAPRRRR
jgi:outer membrane protein OmpA-like peptidoglycan-associated protein